MSTKTAFIFPGQGSQTVGMLKLMGENFPSLKETFAVASTALGYDLWRLVQEGPSEKLNQTVYTQPALLTASIAVWQLWKTQGGRDPIIMAGHSLGEYSALVCAGALKLTDAVKLVAERGRYMQEAVPEGEGAMAAIVGLENAQVQEACNHAAQGEIVAPVNYNAIGQVVIAGKAAAVERTMQVVQQMGAKLVMKLPVSAPSHCSLMEPAAARLTEQLATINLSKPAIPVINNVDVAVVDDPFSIKNALIRQLYNPVRWVEIIQTMAQAGVETFIECGAGKVLGGLNKRIDASLITLSISDPQTLQQALNN